MVEGMSVLLVDDDPRFLRILSDFLKSHAEIGSMSTAVGGEAAIAAARDLRPDVIVIDLIMPGMSGLEAIPRLRELLPEVYIIAISVATTNGYVTAALAAGADHFIPKRRLDRDLLPTLRSLMPAPDG